MNSDKNFTGFMWTIGNKALILKSEKKNKCKEVYTKFIVKYCQLHSRTDITEQLNNEHNYRLLKQVVTPIIYRDCGFYVSIEYENGTANYPKTDMDELIIFE